MHDVVAWIHDLAEWSEKIHSHYKLSKYHNLCVFEGYVEFHVLVVGLCMVSLIMNIAYSSLYFATQWHSMINLRNTLTVWWQYELCAGERGLALYVSGCSNNTKHIQNICWQVHVCFKYCQTCLTENCSMIITVYLKIACLPDAAGR